MAPPGAGPPQTCRTRQTGRISPATSEIAAQETFNYAVLDVAESALLGCVYIDPPDDDSPRGTDAVVSWWVVDDEVGTDLERTLGELIPLWLAETWRFRSVHYEP
jgi:hypothetical protein